MKQVNNEKLNIPIFFTFDENYVIPAIVAISSLLLNAKKEHFYKLHVVYLENGLSYKSIEKLEKLVDKFPNASIEFRKADLDIDNIWNDTFQAHYSKEMFLKLFAGSVFPEYDKIICTDVDVVFDDDVSTAFTDFDIDDFYMAGIRLIEKIEKFIDGQAYSDEIKETLKKGIGGGFLVYNLKKMREYNIEEKFVENLQKYKEVITQPEQDIINLTLPAEKVLKLPLKYMFCTYMYRLIRKEKVDTKCYGKWFYYLTKVYKNKIKADKIYSKEEIEEAFGRPVQIHYATVTKPWNRLFCYRKLVWLKYLLKSGHLTDYVFMKLKGRV